MFVGGIRALLAAVAAPAGHGRGGRALGLQGRPLGPAAAHQRPSSRRRPSARWSTPRQLIARVRAHPRAGARHRPGRTAVRRERPAPAALGPRHRGGQLPRRPPAVRRAAADGRRRPTGTSRRPRSWPTRLGGAGPADERGRAAGGAGAYRPELASTPAAREAARFLLLTPPLPLPARAGYAGLAAAAVALLPALGTRDRCGCRGCRSPSAWWACPSAAPPPADPVGDDGAAWSRPGPTSRSTTVSGTARAEAPRRRGARVRRRSRRRTPRGRTAPGRPGPHRGRPA